MKSPLFSDSCSFAKLVALPDPILMKYCLLCLETITVSFTQLKSYPFR